MVTTTTGNPRKDAERILDTLWTPMRIPVDPVKIARRLGIEVIEAELARNVSGALVKRPDEDPVIMLNGRDSPNRKRFSCAHEVGHFVKRSDDPDEYEYIDLRGARASAGTDADEVYANAFAAELLMPEKEIKRRKGKSEVEMAVAFDVSREAMHNRLKNLGLLK